MPSARNHVVDLDRLGDYAEVPSDDQGISAGKRPKEEGNLSIFPSLAELRRKAQPSEVLARRNAEHWTGRLYIRHISIHLTRMLIPTGISANGVTWLMLLTGVAGASVLFSGRWW